MRKEKIGLLTLVGRKYNNNIGAILQAYALQRIIKKLGFDCEIIDFEPPIDMKNSLIMPLVASIKARGFKWTLLRAFDRLLRERERIKGCYDFKKAYLNFTPQTFKDKDDLRHLDYDIYIVGSDTVWSPKIHIKALRVYLLEFVKNRKKISYATSIWYPIPDRLCPIYKSLLRDFDFISVREETSARYLKECGIEIDPEIVLDPTLLLSKEEWKRISKPPEETVERPYIMFYDVHPTKGLISEVFSIAKKRGVNIVTNITAKYTPFMKFNYPRVYSFYSPAEFLWLVENAEYIITTSFHGTIFSVLFRKPFYSIKPTISPANKIFDFLKKVGLEDRFIRNPKDLKSKGLNDDINWKNTERRLKREVNHSIHFLKKALRGC